MFLVPLWGIFIMVVILAMTMNHEDEWAKKTTCILIILMLFPLLNMTFTFSLLYLSPQGSLEPSKVGNLASEMLECASERLPTLSLHFSKIGDCLHDVNTYSVRPGRLPYMGSRAGLPQAFVIPRLDKKSVFVTKYYQESTLLEKSLIMIHECAHIGLGAHDYAYRWEPHFNNLTREEQYNNADSFMDLVLTYCANLSKSTAFRGTGHNKGVIGNNW